jgi:hypothetical protein
MRIPFGRRRRRGPDPSPAAIDEFIVFGHMRCGSTTLARALERHPDVRILNEPFNSNFTTYRPGSRDYLALVTDDRSMDEQLAHMFEEHDGVKTLGYQIPWELSAHMLRNAERRVIFLKRLNVLQTVVSGLISQQTGIWHSWDVDDTTDMEGPLEPLSIDFVRGGVADVAEEIAYFDEVVASRTGPTLVLTFDELYGGTREDRRHNLARTFDFIGAEAPPPDETDGLLDPAQTKLNSAETYLRLPNAREIDAALGNDETGWLFRDSGRLSSGPSIDGSSSKVQ